MAGLADRLVHECVHLTGLSARNADESEGLIAGEQVAAGLEKAREKIEALKPGIHSLYEALRNFGLKTQTELQATTDKLGASYHRSAHDVRVSLTDQRKAFEA